MPYTSDRFAPHPFAHPHSVHHGPLTLCRTASAAAVAEWRNTRRSVSGLRRACPTVFRFYPRLHFPVARLSIIVAPSSLPLPPTTRQLARARAIVLHRAVPSPATRRCVFIAISIRGGSLTTRRRRRLCCRRGFQCQGYRRTGGRADLSAKAQGCAHWTQPHAALGPPSPPLFIPFCNTTVARSMSVHVLSQPPIVSSVTKVLMIKIVDIRLVGVLLYYTRVGKPFRVIPSFSHQFFKKIYVSVKITLYIFFSGWQGIKCF